MKLHHPVTRAALGVAALVAIAVLANWLVAITPAGNRGKDFTENRIHTLSDGTRAILAGLDTPVTIRYYASRNTDFLPEQLKLHMRRVDDLLREYVALSNGRLRVEYLDPEPDTDAEDSANLDGLRGQRINDENLFFGLAVSCLDQRSVIPFLDPREETMLEYHLSRAISEVSAPTRPVIGLMSALDLQGSPAFAPGQPSDPGWIIYQQLSQVFEVRDLGMEPESIDPREIQALLMFHPAGISPEAEYAVDQYLLAGGTVVACLDAYSVAAQRSGGGNPMMGMGGAPLSSTLPTLLGAWGVTFESSQVVADPVHATSMGDGRAGLAVLTLPQSAMPQKDDIITRDLNSVTFLLPGGFTRTGGAGVAMNSLIQSSTEAGAVDGMRAAQLDPSLFTSLRPRGSAYDLMLHLSGSFRSAFPDGRPGAAAGGEEEAGEDSSAHLATADRPGNVFLIADVDAFYDDFAFSIQNFGGMRFASPINGNASLLFNILDQAAGSPHLIGSRSRAAVRRPFTRIQEMEAEFNQRMGARIEEFERKRDEAIERLSELEAQRSRSADVYLPEEEAEIRRFREERVEAARAIRELEKDLRREKDRLAGRLTLWNVAAMPTVVFLAGIGLMLRRRAVTRAR